MSDKGTFSERLAAAVIEDEQVVSIRKVNADWYSIDVATMTEKYGVLREYRSLRVSKASPGQLITTIESVIGQIQTTVRMVEAATYEDEL